MNNRFVVITGTSSGTGKATATTRARQGHTIFAGVRRQTEKI